MGFVIINTMIRKILTILLSAVILCGCQEEAELSEYPESPSITRDEVLYCHFADEAEWVDAGAAYLDFSPADSGYVGARVKDGESSDIKLRVTHGEETYTYDLCDRDINAIPLQMGSGIYTFKVFQQVEGSNYAMIYSEDVDADPDDELSVYLYPNQVVDYDENSLVVEKSFEQVEGDTDDLTRAYHLYVYVLQLLSYDNEKAAEVADIYVLPDLDEAITTGKGICFDYAALLAALCRIQKIPARVIVGYTDIEYHAWVELYFENEGWINPKIAFAAEDWVLVDPTFADSGKDYEGLYDEVYHY